MSDMIRALAAEQQNLAKEMVHVALENQKLVQKSVNLAMDNTRASVEMARDLTMSASKVWTEAMLTKKADA
jgi:hypothetical protein